MGKYIFFVNISVFWSTITLRLNWLEVGRKGGERIESRKNIDELEVLGYPNAHNESGPHLKEYTTM
jgi:hypothetical protein